MIKSYDDRKFVLLAIFLLIAVVYIFRLFYIQVIDNTYTLSARNQTLQYLTQYPARGLVYDRNGELLVFNEAAYDLMVVPREVKNPDTLEFCQLLGISPDDFKDRFQKAKEYSRYKPSIFEKMLTAEEFAAISGKLYLYPGFFGQQRTLRKYPQKTAAHVLGYIGEVDNNITSKNPYYKTGDYIGVSGLEKYYEEELRGQRGLKIVVKDVHNRIKGSFKKGEYDTLAIPGLDLFSSLDVELQQYGERLMQNKKGSIVAIEPSTGEILCLVSSPSYDPNFLVGRDRAKNYMTLLNNDSLVPLFNRALMASYPPGSTFKLVQSLVGMQERVISENTGFACNKALVGCHDHPSAMTLQQGIQMSCNPYFFNVFKRIINQNKSTSNFKDSEIGLGTWQKHVMSFGLGKPLELDLPDMKGGRVPGVKYYDKIYGSGRWAFSTIYSLSIGQGEVELIPLQMANLSATIANRGFYFTPHLVRSVKTKTGNTPEKYLEKHFTTVDSSHFNIIIEGMRRVVQESGGTARQARIDSIIVCGKTGTVETTSGRDHSVFMAFAPMENPKIAISVYTENAGFGGAVSAPIASLIMEKYLTGSIKDTLKERNVLEADFIKDPGKPKVKVKRR